MRDDEKTLHGFSCVTSRQMIGSHDLKTPDGEALFAAHCESVRRYAKSRGCSAEDADEIAQETGARVWQKIAGDESLRINGGFFIAVAKNVLLEHRRRFFRHGAVFEEPREETSEAPRRRTEAEKRLSDFADEAARAFLSDCQLDCFVRLSRSEQLLLWRYIDDGQLSMETEEPESYQYFFGSILDTLRDIRRAFLPLQSHGEPLAAGSRLKVFRLRRRLRADLRHRISRKKGVA